MQFTTPITVLKSNFPIDYNSKIISVGSCFAINMGEKFDYFKFDNLVNPFGIIFNAVSVEKLVSRIVNKHYFSNEDVFFYNEAWHCFDVHSELSNPNKEDFLIQLNQLIDATKLYFEKLTHCIITLGTSWVYKNIETNKIVANCHKLPQKYFVKELLSVAQTEASLENIIFTIQTINPNCSFIFTVSPVRHIKDGFIENNVSKANLLAALYSLSLKLSIIKYFPSYEIMMDELRDYRFYATDMLHPNSTATNYIWNKFFENYVNDKEFEGMKKVNEIQKALKHRPFNPDSSTHLKFLANLNNKINTLAKLYPQIKF